MSEKHIEDSSAPLIEHLSELRSRLMWSVGALVIAILATFPFAEQVFKFLAEPSCAAFAERGRTCDFQILGHHQIFFTYVSISIFAGFCLSFPFIAYQLWRFVAPGLYRSEQKAFLPFLVASPALFLAGAAFAYYGAMPLAMDFFLNFESPSGGEDGVTVEIKPAADVYLRLTMKFVLAFGLCFQLPVALTLMGKAGLVGSDGLGRNRKYAVVGILIVAAIATPPDIFSQLLLFSVVYSLYEGSIILVRMVEKKREEQLRAEGYYDDEDEDWDDEDEDDDYVRDVDHEAAEKGV